MAGLKEIRTRISSVTSTRQITSAMKMVSAARLRKAQTAIIQMRPYANKLYEILQHLSSNLDTIEDNLFAQNRPIERVLIITISSNRGLCGAFNSSVVGKAIELAQNKYQKLLMRGRVDFLTIGKKAGDVLRFKGFTISSQYNSLHDSLTFSNVAPVAQNVMNLFSNGTYDRIELVYNQFKNAAVQVLVNEQFLPVSIPKENKTLAFRHDFIFEPNKDEIIKELIPKSLKIQFYKALLESSASEHGARMTAMHQATDNASELIKSLKLNYNKARQASITKEILEIVGGAEALKG